MKALVVVIAVGTAALIVALIFERDIDLFLAAYTPYTRAKVANECLDGDSAACGKQEEWCEKGDGGRCYTLGLLYSGSGAGTQRNHLLATTCFRKACELDYGPGCEAIDRWADAVRVFRKDCDKGDQWSCYNLGELMVSGKGTPADAQHGRELMRIACEKDPGPLGMACKQR